MFRICPVFMLALACATFSAVASAGTLDGDHVIGGKTIKISTSGSTVTVACSGYNDQYVDLADGAYNANRLTFGNVDVHIGTSDADTITAEGNQNNLIFGLGGNDRIDGGNLEDLIYGGEGVDKIRALAGDDRVHGEEGDDQILGGDDKDTINGGFGDDALEGEDGDDTISGEGGNDTLRGGDGDDVLHGGGDSDHLFGGGGSDVLIGSTGNDYLEDIDKDFVDYLYGGEGNDILAAVDTNPDTVPKDPCTGGDGDDTFWCDDDDDQDLSSVAGNNDSIVAPTDPKPGTLPGLLPEINSSNW